MLTKVFLISLLTFVQLNCENFFDFMHDDDKEDIEFTPEGDRRWNENKFWTKLRNISSEIISCGMEGDDWRLPDLVALCEVENDTVMEYLVNRSPLRRAGYEYVMTNSPDIRGIDVALLYHPGKFRLIDSYPLRITPTPGMRPTRDILYASGRIITGDTIHILITHAPSKYGGEKRTRPNRMLVTDRLCEATDSIRAVCAEPCIIIAGDFNEYASSETLKKLYDRQLTNISEKAKGKNGALGSYKYKGEWNSIDHILVGGKLAEYHYETIINDSHFLLEDDERYGGKQPFRTYRGWKYRKGYSDHLPVVARFKLP